ncbi:amphiphysin-like [Tympanuchus pallidicinctus]|uniref:amphiphysin-like n=1 Tax=Tympanuchus pallidicinctus TaxID=109042 RepID=UPI002286DDC5|nr:amphiphysin-like [Tympanuchus pallidicinctus]
MEPASNNAGEGEEHGVMMNESEDAAAEMGTQALTVKLAKLEVSRNQLKKCRPSQDQPASAGGTASDMPLGFLFKVEVLHDFEAANGDQLNLNGGDIALVIPSETTADQEAA